MTSVLITGATGFLGGYTVGEFARHGYRVVASGRDKGKLGQLTATNVHIVKSSLADLGNLTAQVDYVVHAAALSTIWGSWDDFYISNVDGTRSVVEFCVRNQVKRLVFVSSPSIYAGRENRLNIAEADYDATNTLNFYIKSKIMAEQLVRAAQSPTLQIVIIRPRGLIGVGDTSIIPRLLRANNGVGVPLFNSGNNLMDVTCVENVALALRLAVESNLASGNTYNITNGEPRAFKVIFDTLLQQIGLTPHYWRASRPLMYVAANAVEAGYRAGRILREPPITKYTVCTLGYSQTLDITRAVSELGYAPIMTLDEGISHYASNYQ